MRRLVGYALQVELAVLVACAVKAAEALYRHPGHPCSKDEDLPELLLRKGLHEVPEPAHHSVLARELTLVDGVSLPIVQIKTLSAAY